jgi:hypothetical protein
LEEEPSVLVPAFRRDTNILPRPREIVVEPSEVRSYPDNMDVFLGHGQKFFELGVMLQKMGLEA